MATLFSQDSFAGAAGTALEDHTPDTGSSWARVAGDSGTVELDGAGKLRPVPDEFGLSIVGTYIVNEDLPDRTCSVQVTYTRSSDVTFNNDLLYLYARYETSIARGYRAGYSGSTDTWFLTVLGGATTSVAAALGLGSTVTVQLEVTGTTVTLYVNGVSVVSQAVALYGWYGKVGLAFMQEVGTPDDTGARVDNFIAYYGVGTPAPALVNGPAFSKLARYRGRYGWSIDGYGGTSPWGGTITADVPAGAVVEKALLLHSVALLPGPSSIVFDGVTIAGADWTELGEYYPAPPPNDTFALSGYYRDVTAQVAAKVGAGGSPVNFTISSETPDTPTWPGWVTNGEILAVIYSLASIATDRTILVLGGRFNSWDEGLYNKTDINLQEQTGNGFSAPVAGNWLFSYGVGYSFQPTGQVTLIDVTTATFRVSTRLSSSAGGQDDGGGTNDALLTVGGLGDVNVFPNPNPWASAAGGPRTDDELYDLASGNNQSSQAFYQAGQTLMTIRFQDNSLDEHGFFAAFNTTEDIDVPDPILTGFDTDCN